MWRSFEQLSGGQQALAALALSLAIHSTLKSSWFLCDEADAALDVLRASHLADFMLHSDKQFLVVSHKPEVCTACLDST
jgi:chromosome segregation ATPase